MRTVTASPAWASSRAWSSPSRACVQPKVTVQYPEVVNEISPRHRGRLHAALRRGRHAQVRDLLPVRAGLPHRVHRHGRRGHQEPLPRPLGRRPSSTPSGARSRRCAAPAGRCRTAPFEPFAPIDLAPLERILAEEDYDPRRAAAILERTQDAYGHLPVAALQHISHPTGAWYSEIYGIATSYPHLRFEPPSGHVVAVCRCAACTLLRRRPGRWRAFGSTWARTSAASARTARCASRATDCRGEPAAQPCVTRRRQRAARADAPRTRRPSPAALRGARRPGAGRHEHADPGRRDQGWPRVLLARAGATTRRRASAAAERAGAWAAWKQAAARPDARRRSSASSASRPARPRRRGLPDRRQVARLRGAAVARRATSSPTASRPTRARRPTGR